MKIKKALSFLLVLSLITSFAACSKDKADKGSETSSPKENSLTQKLKDELDFKGETITFCYPPGYGLINTNGTDSELTLRDEKLKEIEKKFNVKIQQKEGKGTYWNATAMSIASGQPSGHVMLVSSGYFWNWFKAGAIANLNEAMKTTGIDMKNQNRYSQIVRRSTNIDDGQYCFSPYFIHPTQHFLYFNKRIFEEQNLGNPYDWIKDKTWTWDKFEEIMKKATIRNSDGTTRQYGVGGLNIFSIYNSENLGYFDKNGVGHLIDVLPDEGIKKIDRVYNWMYVDKCVYIPPENSSWETIGREFLKGNMAMCIYGNKIMEWAEESAWEDDFGVAYIPLDKGEKEYKAEPNVGQFYFIPKTYESMADKLLLLIDELYSVYEDVNIDKLIKDKYISRVRDQESIECIVDVVKRANKNGSTVNLSPAQHIGWGDPSIYNMKAEVQKTKPSDYWAKYHVVLENKLKDSLEGHKYTG